MEEDRGTGGKEPGGQEQLGRVLSLNIDRVDATPSSAVVGDIKRFTELIPAVEEFLPTGPKNARKTDSHCNK